jgi:hypothetical protein
MQGHCVAQGHKEQAGGQTSRTLFKYEFRTGVSWSTKTFEWHKCIRVADAGTVAAARQQPMLLLLILLIQFRTQPHLGCCLICTRRLA